MTLKANPLTFETIANIRRLMVKRRLALMEAMEHGNRYDVDILRRELVLDQIQLNQYLSCCERVTP